MDINKIKPYENNPRINVNAVSSVASSIREFGFQAPIVIDENGMILAGHTRYFAAKSLGITDVPVVVSKGLSEQKKKAYRIADNKTAENSVWNKKKLLSEVAEIDGAFTGFSDEELKHIEETRLAANVLRSKGKSKAQRVVYPLVISENAEQYKRFLAVKKAAGIKKNEDVVPYLVDMVFDQGDVPTLSDEELFEEGVL